MVAGRDAAYWYLSERGKVAPMVYQGSFRKI